MGGRGTSPTGTGVTVVGEEPSFMKGSRFIEEEDQRPKPTHLPGSQRGGAAGLSVSGSCLLFCLFPRSSYPGPNPRGLHTVFH